MILRLILQVSLASVVTFSSAAAQDNSANQSEIKPEKTATIKWEFGIEVKGTGDASGLSMVVPIPIEWPEQQIVSLELVKSEGISKVEYKDLDDLAKLMSIRVGSIRNGQTETAVARMEIQKSNIVAPADPSKFVFAKKPKGDLRKFLKPSPYIESRHGRIRKVSDAINVNEQDNAWSQVETIYEWVRDNIEYKFDQQIHTCVEALDAGHGDCEELTSLFIAICRQRGIPARAVWIPHHTYPEFYLEDGDGNGHWFPCQAAGNYEFGSMTDHSPILHKGDNFRVPGHKKAMRYVQPTLRADRVTSAPQLKWIMRDLEKKNKPNQYRQESIE